jgi:hypothetical protein
MKPRNPVTRDMIANPNRNQGRHKDANERIRDNLADILDTLEEYHEYVETEGHKYIVQYSGDYILRKSGDGYYAILNATDHPRAGPGHVITSKLVWINFELGAMETQNTVYIPEEDE